ncbi:prenyltransferase/squalene oxidase repeat-containing protein [Maioricimonas sp. JC845]|uniref:prenyltransferase/squalene oxidase repeat-containing protein n=1 Tax=Maioricimonas sp. JC845 TaxID=3232138 RepID=UPI00345B0129
MQRVAILLLGTLLPTLSAADGFAASAAEIEAARLKGVEYLKSQQADDGSWHYEGHAVGITSLCGLALLENGMSVSDPVVEKAQRFVRRNLDDLKNTYDLALAILFLSRVGDRDNRTPIRSLAARLVAGQNVEGGWGYNCPIVNPGILSNPKSRPDPPDGPGDNSCTQFATLGLWVASRWGVNVDDTMARVGERFVSTQKEDGGWPYRHDVEDQGSRSSMTYAGLFCLTVARATRIRQLQSDSTVRRRLDEPDETADGPQSTTLLADPVFSKGLEKAGNFAKGINRNSARYFLWSVERMGVMLGLPEFGGTNWFEKGATALVESQGEDGEWKHPSESRGSLSDTAFAILFLRRANLGSDISRLLEGEPDRRFQIVSREGKPRYRRLTDALKAAKDGDVIHIDGAGPFEMPHLDLDKSLTIAAGPGYTPVMIFALGYDDRGRRLRPEDDVNARHMLRINKGTVTLEGLHFQFDPPNVGYGLPWAAIVLNGGNLRMLNCAISESNERGMVPVLMDQAGSLVIRNSLLVGGRAALELTVNGTQNVTLENCVVFSKNAFNVFQGSGGDSRLKLTLDRCAVQARDVFFFPRLATPVDIVCTGTAYKADWMGSKMLPALDGHEGLTWTGSRNIYDLLRWVGADGQENTRVKDHRSWDRFWGGTDEDGEKRVIPFAGRRPHEAFTHGIRGEDFEFAPNSAVYNRRRETGIDPLVVGPGNGYSRFRDSFQYREWQQGDAGSLAVSP